MSLIDVITIILYIAWTMFKFKLTSYHCVSSSLFCSPRKFTVKNLPNDEIKAQGLFVLIYYQFTAWFINTSIINLLGRNLARVKKVVKYYIIQLSQIKTLRKILNGINKSPLRKFYEHFKKERGEKNIHLSVSSIYIFLNKQQRSGPSPQSCLYFQDFQDFQDSRLLSSLTK